MWSWGALKGSGQCPGRSPSQPGADIAKVQGCWSWVTRWGEVSAQLADRLPVVGQDTCPQVDPLAGEGHQVGLGAGGTRAGAWQGWVSACLFLAQHLQVPGSRRALRRVPPG